MAKKNDNNFKKAMNELLGAPAVKEETAKPAAKEVVKETVKEEPKKAAPVAETAKPAAKVKREEAVIPEGMVITGNIKTESDMRVLGNIVGDVVCDGNILLYGNIEGNVSAENITIQSGSMQGDVTVKADAILEDASTLKGNLTAVNVLSNAKTQGQIIASGTVELKNQAFVNGDITAATFSVTSGAKIKGTVTINE